MPLIIFSEICDTQAIIYKNAFDEAQLAQIHVVHRLYELLVFYVSTRSFFQYYENITKYMGARTHVKQGNYCYKIIFL